MKAAALTLTILLGSACSSGRTQADCDRIADNIRIAAKQRGYATQGICSHPPPDLQAACDDLRKCQAEVDD